MTLFAYPNGRPNDDYHAEHVRMVKEAGFDAAVSTSWEPSPIERPAAAAAVHPVDTPSPEVRSADAAKPSSKTQTRVGNMWMRFAEKLRCPLCKGALQLRTFEGSRITLAPQFVARAQTLAC